MLKMFACFYLFKISLGSVLNFLTLCFCVHILNLKEQNDGKGASPKISPGLFFF